MSYESWNELKTSVLEEQVPRLIVAARDSDDPLTRKVRRMDIKTVENILRERGRTKVIALYRGDIDRLS